jgi:putative sigma-54 modulation protein
MTLSVTGRHLELSSNVRQQIQKKFARLDRLLNDKAVSAQCTIDRERTQHICEITIHARGDHILVAVGKHERLLTAVGTAIEKVAAQAQKLTGRWKTGKRQRTPVPEAVASVVPARPARARRTRAAAAAVVRATRYRVRTLTAEEAAGELGEAAFLVFRQAATGRVTVVFRRPDGKVGLIDPQD